MIEHKVDSIKEERLKELRAEMAEHDYRAIKTIWDKYGDIIEKEYPGEKAWRKTQIKKIHDLEGRA